ISIVRQGRIVETGSLAQLRHMTRTTFVAELDQGADPLTRLEGIHDLTTEDGAASFQVDGDRVDGVVRALAPLGVRSLVAHPPTVEQLLMRHYGDGDGDRGGAAAADRADSAESSSIEATPRQEVSR